MSRILFIIAIVVIVLWWMFRRRRGNDAARPDAPRRDAPQAMVICAHCSVHLPSDDAVADAQGRQFCGEAHRLAGPR